MMDSIKKEISDYNHDFKSKHPDREVPIHEAEFNKLLKDVYVESLKEQLYKASAFLKLQTEEASIFNQDEVKELKEISQALDEKLKGIDFSKIDNSTDLISDVSKQLNTASAFMSKFNLLDKVTVSVSYTHLDVYKRQYEIHQQAEFVLRFDCQRRWLLSDKIRARGKKLCIFHGMAVSIICSLRTAQGCAVPKPHRASRTRGQHVKILNHVAACQCPALPLHPGRT